MKKNKLPKRRKSLAALIAAEPDIERKLRLAWLGKTAYEQDTPAVSLAIEFRELRKFDIRSPRTGHIARFAFRSALKRAQKHLLEALMNGDHVFFASLAKAMRRAERFEFEPLWSRTPEERYKWMDILSAKNHKVSIGSLARHFCEIHHGNTDKVRSVERHFRRLRKLLSPLTRKA